MKLHPIISGVFAVLAVTLGGPPTHSAEGAKERWSVERANAWYREQPWPVGCVYVTSTAVNQIEMWQSESFDPVTIERELGWAEDLGFNTVRIFLHNLVWEADPAGFKSRLDTFLDIADRHHIRVIVTIFTNGGSGDSEAVQLGKQQDPVPGVHNSRWVQSPGASVVNDPARWGVLEKYTKDVVGTFAHDRRVLMWCVYNEPENRNGGARSLPLLRQAFTWFRSVKPDQPLTSPIWHFPDSKKSSLDIISFLGENSDIISFHCYDEPQVMESFVKLLRAFQRPLVCTEYMARTRGSTFEGILPILKRERVGAISLGLVAGKTNTVFPWGSKPGSTEPKLWFHNILRRDGTPFDANEVVFIKEITGASLHRK